MYTIDVHINTEERGLDLLSRDSALLVGGPPLPATLFTYTLELFVMSNLALKSVGHMLGLLREIDPRQVPFTATSRRAKNDDCPEGIENRFPPIARFP